MAGRARVVAIRACRVPSCKANLIIFCCACELTDASIASDTHNLPQTADFWWGVFITRPSASVLTPSFITHFYGMRSRLYVGAGVGQVDPARGGWSRSSQL